MIAVIVVLVLLTVLVATDSGRPADPPASDPRP